MTTITALQLSARALLQAHFFVIAVVSFALLCAIPQHSAMANDARTEAKRRPLIFVPGLLGSRLCRFDPGSPNDPVTVWGTLGALREFPTLQLSADPEDAAVKPCGLIREIVHLGMFTQEVYGPIIEHLQDLGYEENRDLFLFDYDWRRSVFENAERLASFVREKVPDESQKVDLLAHSMGGLIARIYAVKYGGGERLGRLISAGTPFQGSVKVFATLERGWGTMNMLMGGIKEFRQTVLSFPSTFELMPRYSGCCAGDNEAAPGFAPNEIESWLALDWDGITPDALPELADVARRQRELQAIVDAGLPGSIEDILFIGVDQRTPERFAIESGRGRARIRVKTTWAGDGTVVRESATMPRGVVHPTSFSDHEHILSDEQVQEFLSVTLTRGLNAAVQTVAVQPRSKVRTALGRITELVGVAVQTEEPVLGTGEQARIFVHVRLGTQEPLPAERIRLTVRRPDGRETPVTLRSDPAASDPTNPFEQSFTAQFGSGMIAGNAVITAAVALDEGSPRIVTEVVPILPR